MARFTLPVVGMGQRTVGRTNLWSARYPTVGNLTIYVSAERASTRGISNPYHLL
jgi:hypothetical protein